jgi:hypothetical protein
MVNKAASGDPRAMQQLAALVRSGEERRGNELRLVGPPGSCFERTPLPSLVKAIARARDWYERIVAGEVSTVVHLAKETGLPLPYVKCILKCARLSPQMTEAVLSGKHRPNLTLQELLQNVPIDWREQEHGILLPRLGRNAP